MSWRSVLAPATVAALSYALMGVELAAFGPVIGEWMRDFGVGPATVGTVFTASALGSIAATLAYAPVVHRWGLKGALAAGSAVFGLGLAVAALAPVPGMLLAGFVVAGAGFAVLDSGINHLYVRLFPGVRAAALNLVHLFFAVGAAAAPVAMAVVLPVSGWRPVYGAMSGAALATAVALYATCPAGDGADAVTGAPWSTRVLRALVKPALAMALYVGVEVTVSGWAFSFLAQEAGASPILAGTGISIFWAGLAVGRLLLGPVVERVGYRPSLVAAAAVAGVTLLAAVLPVSPAMAAALLGLSGLAMSVIFPTLVALASTLVPADDTATATATAVMLLSASAGTMSLPALAGVAAGWTGLRPVMAILGTLLPAGFLAVLGFTRAAGLEGAQDSVRASSVPVKRTRHSASLKAANPATAQAIEAAARRSSSTSGLSSASEGLHPKAEGLKVRRIASSQ